MCFNCNVHRGNNVCFSDLKTRKVSWKNVPHEKKEQKSTVKTVKTAKDLIVIGSEKWYDLF